MTTNGTAHRIWSHLKRDIILLRSTLLTSLAICAALLFVFIQLKLFWNKSLSADTFYAVLALLYILSGIVLCFSYFKELHDETKRSLYLTLPISTGERLLSIWLSTTMVHSLAFLALGVVFGGVSIFFGSLLFGAELDFVNMTFENYWTMFKTYVFLLPVFLFGAASFSKNRRAKTILLVVITIIALIFFNMFLYGVLNHGLDVFEQNGLGSKAFDLAQEDFSGVGRLLFLSVLGPVLVLATYFKMKEKEG